MLVPGSPKVYEIPAQAWTQHASRGENSRTAGNEFYCPFDPAFWVCQVWDGADHYPARPKYLGASAKYFTRTVGIFKYARRHDGMECVARERQGAPADVE